MDHLAVGTWEQVGPLDSKSPDQRIDLLVPCRVVLLGAQYGLEFQETAQAVYLVEVDADVVDQVDLAPLADDSTHPSAAVSAALSVSGFDTGTSWKSLALGPVGLGGRTRSARPTAR